MVEFIVKYRVFAGYLFALITLIYAKPTWYSFIIGLLFVAVGETIRIWAAGYIHKDKKLTKTGPYAVVRNPLYVGTFIMGLGIVIASANFILLVIYPLIFALIYVPTIRYEEKKLERIFGGEYIEYKRSVPSFFPVLRKLSEARCGSWSFELAFIKHKEWRAVLVNLLIFFIFLYKIYQRSY